MPCALKLGTWPCSLQALPCSDTLRLPQAEPQPGSGPPSSYSRAARVGIAGPDSGQDRPQLDSPCCAV